MSEAVLVERHGNVAEVRLNRPDKHNAIDGEIIDGLLEAQQSISADPAVRVVVLSGEGKSFCAGLDMASFAEMVSGDLTADSAAVEEIEERSAAIGASWTAEELDF